MALEEAIIFRNTPQWFIAMDMGIASLPIHCARALHAISVTRWVPELANRITGMIESARLGTRASAWGVPIAVLPGKGDGSLKF